MSASLTDVTVRETERTEEMEDRVSREAKLQAAKEIVATYIKSAMVKEGENSRLALSPNEVCDLFRQVYGTIDDAIPTGARKMGLGI